VRGASGKLQAWHRVAGHQLYQPIDPLISLGDEQKVACWSASIARRASSIRAWCE